MLVLWAYGIDILLIFFLFLMILVQWLMKKFNNLVLFFLFSLQELEKDIGQIKLGLKDIEKVNRVVYLHDMIFTHISIVACF